MINLPAKAKNVEVKKWNEMSAHGHRTKPTGNYCNNNNSNTTAVLETKFNALNSTTA